MPTKRRGWRADGGGWGRWVACAGWGEGRRELAPMAQGIAPRSISARVQRRARSRSPVAATTASRRQGVRRPSAPERSGPPCPLRGKGRRFLHQTCDFSTRRAWSRDRHRIRVARPRLGPRLSRDFGATNKGGWKRSVTASNPPVQPSGRGVPNGPRWMFRWNDASITGMVPRPPAADPGRRPSPHRRRPDRRRPRPTIRSGCPCRRTRSGRRS